MNRRKIFIAILMIFFASSFATQSFAQVKLEDLKDLDLSSILGKTKLLKVKKGFSPVFSLGNYQINTVGLLGEKLKGVSILGEILDTKGIDKIMGMYKTYKTGLVVYKILSSAGTIVAVVGAIKGFSNSEKFDDATVKKMLYPALAGVATGVLTKVLTKAASYKAVDIFNGVVRNKVKDILSIRPASETLGLGLYVKL
ncbi:hypothetical protein [Ferruginibacter sp. HRS2-29]|uniref:hypothetical protein n=1 Tax=Ferruginibacter sp. HRS2-29 TaxID=2487334 RepID=UPI0020CC82D8|nr:hypothetical protein [Ferruginibacter sp. HRS2-29]MCP9750281.1 hypothetical protein [Ferruginibacter sp. HRS2-29]